MAGSLCKPSECTNDTAPDDTISTFATGYLAHGASLSCPLVQAAKTPIREACGQV